MKIVFLVFNLWIITTLIALAAEQKNITKKVTLITEEYPPFNMRNVEKNRKTAIVGVSTEIIRELFKRGNINYSLHIYPWKRAYKTVKENENHGLFSTFLSPQRKPQFKWVGPIVPNNWILMGKSNRNFNIKTVEDACKYHIGGYRGDAFAAYLEKNGCKVQYTIYNHQNMLKIQLDRIDLWTTGKLVGPYLVQKAKISDLVEVFEIKVEPMYPPPCQNSCHSLKFNFFRTGSGNRTINV
jgi:polar amino acid transport system substrate-binding protein